MNTQLVYAVNHLKSHGNPMRLQDLAIITELPLDTDRVLYEKFKAHDRVVHDPKTDLYSYRVRLLPLSTWPWLTANISMTSMYETKPPY